MIGDAAVPRVPASEPVRAAAGCCIGSRTNRGTLRSADETIAGEVQPIELSRAALCGPADRDGPGERPGRPRHLPAPPRRSGDGPGHPPGPVPDDPGAVAGPTRFWAGRSPFMTWRATRTEAPSAVDVVYLVIGRGTVGPVAVPPGRSARRLGAARQRVRPAPRRAGRLRGRRDRPDAVPGPRPLVAGRRPYGARRKADKPASHVGHPALRRPDRRTGRRASTTFRSAGHRGRAGDGRRLGGSSRVRDRPAGGPARRGASGRRRSSAAGLPRCSRRCRGWPRGTSSPATSRSKTTWPAASGPASVASRRSARPTARWTSAGSASRGRSSRREATWCGRTGAG